MYASPSVDLSHLQGQSAKTGLGDDHSDETEFGDIPPVISKKKKKHAATPLLNYDPIEIARQFTIIGMSLSE